MPSLIQRAREFLTGDYLGIQQKFTPADPTVHWTYVQHLAETANTIPFGLSTADGNSAVFACLRALAFTGIEPPLIAVQKVDKEDEPLPDSQLQEFLENPHPELDMEEIRWWSYWARHADGNAYVIKRRAGNTLTGVPAELWPVSPLRMHPQTERGSQRLIDYYRYERDDGRGDELVPVENVIHFKLGVDPRDPRIGISPIKTLLREIASDAEATKFSQALLSNFGIPGVVIKLPEGAMPGAEAIQSLKDNVRREFGGDQRGKVGVITGGSDMEQFGFSPEQLNLKALHDFPETRIAAVMGVDPLIARLGVGLEQTSNYASARQVRENFTETTLIPQWTMDEKKWTKKLARDFTSDRAIRIVHDLSRVRALQEDENDKHKRYYEGYKTGVLSREETRAALGYDPEMQTGDVVYTPTNVTYVEVGKELTDPEAERELEREANAERMAQLQERNNGAAPAAAQPAAQPAANGAKALTADTYGDLVQAVVDRAAVDFAEDLQKLQDSQERRVTRALVNGQQ